MIWFRSDCIGGCAQHAADFRSSLCPLAFRAPSRFAPARFGSVCCRSGRSSGRFGGGAAADDAIVTKAPAIPFAGPAYNWNGFYAGGHLGYAWGTSNFTASSPGAPSVSGSFGLAQTLDTFNEAGKLLRGFASRVQLHAAEPFPGRRRSRCVVPGVSNSGRPVDRRYVESDIADARRANLHGERARVRHRARPHRLCAGPLAVLRHRRFCLDPQPADADNARHRQHRNAATVAIRLRRRRRCRGADCAALDGAPRISVHRLRQQRHDLLGRRRADRFRTSCCTRCAPA